MAFIRKGSQHSLDFADGAVQRFFADSKPGNHESPQVKLSRIFDRYKEHDALVRLDQEGEVAIVSTPLIVREYELDDDVFNVGLGVGCRENESSTELGVVLQMNGDVFLLAVPQNGIEGVPGTHGVPELLKWFDSRYPMIHPVKDV